MKAILIREKKGIRGDLSDIRGNLSGIWGNLSGITGNLSDITGDIDDCEITDADRERGIHISELIMKEVGPA